MNKLYCYVMGLLTTALLAVPAFAYDPMIDPADFDGIRTDVMTMAGGIISVVLIIIGLSYLISSMRR